MARIALTAQFVKQAVCELGKVKTYYFDTECKGLALEIRQSGGRTYYLRFTDDRGRIRQPKIADANDISLTQARTIVAKRRNEIAMGVDIGEYKRALKKIPTVEEFINYQYLPFVQGYKKSWKCDRGLLKNHIIPVWGSKYLDQVTKADVITLLADHRKTHAPASCNRLLILVRYLFNLALKWETAGLKANPTKGFPLMPENNKQERYLSIDEARVMYGYLQSSPNKMLEYIIPMLLLTGCRKRECLDARWEDFDFERSLWRIHTTKLGKARHVPLNEGAIALLQRVPRFEGCGFVFPNPKTKLPYASIFSAWDSVRTKAGLKDVKLHSLRHSFASYLVNGGRSLYEVQHLLGHTQIKTTARYSHLSQNTLLAASNAASHVVSSMFSPAPQIPINVISIE
jgi:integrase